jgi:hypothetical protein
MWIDLQTINYTKTSSGRALAHLHMCSITVCILVHCEKEARSHHRDSKWQVKSREEREAYVLACTCTVASQPYVHMCARKVGMHTAAALACKHVHVVICHSKLRAFLLSYSHCPVPCCPYKWGFIVAGFMFTCGWLHLCLMCQTFRGLH